MIGSLDKWERRSLFVPLLTAALIIVLVPEIWPPHHLPWWWRPVVALLGLSLDANIIIMSHAPRAARQRDAASRPATPNWIDWATVTEDRNREASDA